MSSTPKYPPSTPEYTPSTQRSHNSDKSRGPDKKGGSAQVNARQWGGGSKASKGAITDEDRHNENSSAKS